MAIHIRVYKKAVGRSLYSLRLAKKLTRKSLAGKSGLTPFVIARIEKGHTLTLEELLTLAGVLEVRPYVILLVAEEQCQERWFE